MPGSSLIGKYVPITTDYGFKVTFGNEHNTLFLRRAIQALTQLKQPVEEIFFEKNTREATTAEGRHMVYDLTIRLDNGEIAIVEMQLSPYAFMIKRLEYYAANRMIPFVKKGNWKFNDIPRIYTIAIMQHSLFPDEDCFRVGCLYDEKHRPMDNTLQFIIVELDKFGKTPETCRTDLDKLIYTMKSVPELNEKGNMPEFMEEEWLASALRELESGRLTPEERANLEISIAREMSSRSEAEVMAEYNMKKWKAEGLAEGRREGIEIGMKEGMKVNIRQLITKHPEWSDDFIADLLNLPVNLVKESRED